MILLYLKPNQRPGEEAGARPISASFCVGSVPSSKILVNNKEVYSNLLLENNFVNSYNQHTYLLNDLILTRSNKSSATTDNPSIYDSYICQDEVTHYSSNPTYYQKILAEKTMWSFVELDENRPAYLELPKPILLNTNGGAVVRFYDSANSSTSCYEHSCTGKAVSLIYNLIPGKTYYYKVYNSSNAIVTLGSFTTQGSIRMIRMDGVRNMRDCGGYTTKDGNSRLKYGVIFRGSLCLPTYYNTTSGEYNCTKLRRKLDGDPSSDNIMIGGATIRDVDEFKKLNIGKDIDLRDAGGDYIVTGSDLKINRCVPFFDPVTDDITYWAASTSISSNPSIPPYGALFGNDTTNTTTISTRKTLFKNFLTLVYDTVSSGKAVYVHCLQGKDRTGTFLATLFALLGIKDDGIIKDYELTSLWAVGLTTRYNFLYGTSNSGKDKSYLTFNTTGSLEDYVKNWLGVTSGSENETLVNNLKSVLLENLSSEPISEEPEVEPSTNKRYIKSITSTPYTGNGTINGDIITWPLQVTLDDNSTMTYQLFRESNLVKETYGDATFTYYNSAAINQGYIDANGNLTYDLSGDNWALDCSYIQSITLPCTSNSSYTRTFTFTDTENDIVTVQKTWNSSKTGVPNYNYAGFDTYMNNKYTFTALSGFNLYYHVTNDFNPKTGEGFKVSKYPTASDRTGHMFAKEIGTDTIIKIINPAQASDSMNRVAIINTNTELTQTTLPSSSTEVFNTSNTTIYSRVSNPNPTGSKSDAKVLYLERNLTVYIRNKTNKAHSYIIFFSIYTAAQVGSSAAILVYEGQ